MPAGRVHAPAIRAIHVTVAHVERIVRDFRRCKEAEELSREAQQHADRELKGYYDADGVLVIKARLPAEVGQMFIKAIQVATEEICEQNVSAETPNVKFRPNQSTRKADALSVMAESFWRKELPHSKVATTINRNHVDPGDIKR